MKVVGVVARSLDNYIGLEIDGTHTLPWKDKPDLSIFKTITMDSFVVMGRKTVESLPNKLNGRKVICLTSNKNYINPKADYIAHNIDDVFNIVDGETLFVCGGKTVYELFKPFMSSVFVSTINIMSSEFKKYDEQDQTHSLIELGDWLSESFYYHIKTWDNGFFRLYSYDPEVLYDDAWSFYQIIDKVKLSQIQAI